MPVFIFKYLNISMSVLCSAPINEIIDDHYYRIAVHVNLETIIYGIDLMLSVYMFHGRINKMKRVSAS